MLHCTTWHNGDWSIPNTEYWSDNGISLGVACTPSIHIVILHCGASTLSLHTVISYSLSVFFPLPSQCHITLWSFYPLPSYCQVILCISYPFPSYGRVTLWRLYHRPFLLPCYTVRLVPLSFILWCYFMELDSIPWYCYIILWRFYPTLHIVMLHCEASTKPFILWYSTVEIVPSDFILSC